MPLVDTTLTLLDESWDSPTEDFSALKESTDADNPRPGAESGEEQASNLALDEQWMAVHGIPAPAWAEVGFAGIKADMARRAAATAGKKEEMTLYCPPRNWDPKHRMRAHIDIKFPGTKVQIVRPVDYPEGHPVPVHALPRFQGNPLDNFNVCGPVPEWLRGYWTTASRSPGWRGESTNDIFRQETRLRNIIMGYAAPAVRHVTTYEYRAPCGLNHGLAVLHDEMSHYLVPPMLEDAAALLRDFIAMKEALSAYQVQIRAHKNQSAHSRQEARNAAFLRDEEDARLRRELNEARTELRQVEAERDDAVSQLLDAQNERREIQAQLSTKAAELRVSEGAVTQLKMDKRQLKADKRQVEADKRQLEIDLDQARRLQRAATTTMGEPELALAQPSSVSVEPAHVPPTPAIREMDEAAAYPANTGPVCAVWPLPKPQGS